MQIHILLFNLAYNVLVFSKTGEAIEIKKKNYDIIPKINGIYIFYSLNDCDSLEGVGFVNITTKEQIRGYDLHISDLKGNELVIFKNITTAIFNKLFNESHKKNIYIAGLDEEYNIGERSRFNILI